MKTTTTINITGHVDIKENSTRTVTHTVSGNAEIERRWIIDKLPEGIYGGVTFHQGYLPNTGSIQERVTHRHNQTVLYRRTIKIGHGISRLEFNEQIDKPTFEWFWPLTEGRRNLKKRHFLKYDPTVSLVWEVTEFLDRSLIMCEIEMLHEDYPLVIPNWLAGAPEVTEDPAFEACNMGK